MGRIPSIIVGMLISFRVYSLIKDIRLCRGGGRFVGGFKV